MSSSTGPLASWPYFLFHLNVDKKPNRFNKYIYDPAQKSGKFVYPGSENQDPPQGSVVYYMEVDGLLEHPLIFNGCTLCPGSLFDEDTFLEEKPNARVEFTSDSEQDLEPILNFLKGETLHCELKHATGTVKMWQMTATHSYFHIQWGNEGNLSTLTLPKRFSVEKPSIRFIAEIGASGILNDSNVFFSQETSFENSLKMSITLYM